MKLKKAKKQGFFFSKLRHCTLLIQMCTHKYNITIIREQYKIMHQKQRKIINMLRNLFLSMLLTQGKKVKKQNGLGKNNLKPFLYFKQRLRIYQPRRQLLLYFFDYLRHQNINYFCLLTILSVSIFLESSFLKWPKCEGSLRARF